MFENSCLMYSLSAFINLYFTISSTLIPQIIGSHFYSLGFYKLNPQNIIFKSRNQLQERIWTICLFRSGCPHSSYFSLFIYLPIDLTAHALAVINITLSQCSTFLITIHPLLENRLISYPRCYESRRNEPDVWVSL